LLVIFLVFSPHTPPLDDPRVRKAFGHTLDRQRIYEQFHATIARGGLVPPGMPGHSPDIGLPFNVELGRKLLAEAGYPGGRNFPKLSAIIPHVFFQTYKDELSRQWCEHLGIEIDFIGIDPQDTDEWTKKRTTSQLCIAGWGADYPDPDNFLRQSSIISTLRSLGWRDAEYDRLLEQAARTRDRAKRMAMYRQADRLLVAEQALALPIAYGYNQQIHVVKPWVKNFKPNLIDQLMFYNFIIEEH